MNEHSPRLLIVDDDESYRHILSRSLIRSGYTVELASSTKEALSIASRFDPEFSILDINLGEESGLGLITKMTEISPGIRIVILTGYASIQTTVAAMKLGASQYLPKPANFVDILGALGEQSVVSVHEAERGNQLSVEQLEWEYIHLKLHENGGNITKTAIAINMHRRTLQRKLAKKRPLSDHLSGN